MIGFLQGKILSLDSPLVVDVKGVGYEVFVPERILPSLRLHSEICLYIVTIVKEDALELLGFETSLEKTLYKLLTSIDGIGPKSGLNILSQIEPENFINVLQTEAPIPKFKGVGKTVSERLNLELRSKIKKAFSSLTHVRSELPNESLKIQELKLALIGFGYNDRTLQTIFSKLDFSKDLTSLIKDSLQLLKSKSSGVKSL